MKVWEVYAQKHKDYYLRKAEEVETRWKLFATTGNCCESNVSCDPCPFVDKHNVCRHSSDALAREYLNREYVETQNGQD